MSDEVSIKKAFAEGDRVVWRGYPGEIASIIPTVRFDVGHLAGIPVAELEPEHSDEFRAVEVVCETVLTWHPLDPDADPVEVPLNQHWVFPADVAGEFRLSTREVPPATADEPPGAAVVVDLLSLVGVTVSEQQAEGWTDDQRQLAARWAWDVHLSASDNDDVEVPPRPAFLDEVSGG